MKRIWSERITIAEDEDRKRVVSAMAWWDKTTATLRIELEARVYSAYSSIDILDTANEPLVILDTVGSRERAARRIIAEIAAYIEDLAPVRKPAPSAEPAADGPRERCRVELVIDEHGYTSGLWGITTETGLTVGGEYTSRREAAEAAELLGLDPWATDEEIAAENDAIDHGTWLQ
jgi:hypothetical protein